MNPAEERRGSDLEALASRIKGGDREAWATFGKRLRRFFCWRGLPGPEAEDLAMDCATDIWMKLDRFEDRGEGSFAAWCYALARNKLADRGRKRKRRRERQLDQAAAGAPDPPEDASIQALGKAVYTALESLSESEREIIELRQFEAADSFAGIGRALGIAEGTARVRYHRALKNLGKVLASVPVVQDWVRRLAAREQITLGREAQKEAAGDPAAQECSPRERIAEEDAMPGDAAQENSPGRERGD